MEAGVAVALADACGVTGAAYRGVLDGETEAEDEEGEATGEGL